MSQLEVEKQLRFSLVRIFITLFHLLLDVFTSFCISAKDCIKSMAAVIAKSTKLSSDNFSPLSINVSNKEPSKKKIAEDFLVTWFRKIKFYEFRKIKETPLQLFGSCDRIANRYLMRVSCFVEFPIFKTKMII